MPEKRYLLALDEGTTSTRSILFDKDLRIISMAQNELTQIYPQPGWVEQDPMEIYANQYATLTECVARSSIDPAEIAAIGITNQRETTVVWDRKTGVPVCNAIVWQCRRTAQLCEELIRNGYADRISKKTGLRPDAYFSATKIRWILDHVEGARERAQAGELLFGTVDTWLLWKLTDGRVHATDRTNASRTMLYDIERDCWDQELLDLLEIPRCMLPQVRSSGEVYGTCHVMGAEIPIAALVGDQQSALFGQGCFEQGDIKTTYGTGCFVLSHTGRQRVCSRHELITTVAAGIASEPVEYALEGSVFIGGAVIQWLRDGLRVIDDASDSEYFAGKVSDSGGVFVVPAFSGLGAPYWDMHATGTITGITRGTGINQIIRASLESIAYQTNDVMQAMQADTGMRFREMAVDGGAAQNALLMQFQSDISDIRIRRPEITEATAAGAVLLAGLACGMFQSREEIRNKLRTNHIFEPEMTEEERTGRLKGWHAAIEACRAFSACGQRDGKEGKTE